MLHDLLSSHATLQNIVQCRSIQIVYYAGERLEVPRECDQFLWSGLRWLLTFKLECAFNVQLLQDGEHGVAALEPTTGMPTVPGSCLDVDVEPELRVWLSTGGLAPWAT